jgi:hypothetical protein
LDGVRHLAWRQSLWAWFKAVANLMQLDDVEVPISQQLKDVLRVARKLLRQYSYSDGDPVVEVPLCYS